MRAPLAAAGPPGAGVRIIGMGYHPEHLTAEASRALAGCDYVLAFDKPATRDRPGDDPLLAFRRAVCHHAGVELVTLPDPTRQRDNPAEYTQAVRDWHTARVAACAEVLRTRGGTAGFLVWGDPALYDSTIRVVAATGCPYTVIPGVSAPTMLAARHGIVLHEIGRPVLVTTGRRLADDVAAGHDNLVVLLDAHLTCGHLTGSWHLWWGVNLATHSERLVAGPLDDT